jgi:hypothetical protein
LVKSNPLTTYDRSEGFAVFVRTIHQGVANGQRSTFHKPNYAHGKSTVW